MGKPKEFEKGIAETYIRDWRKALEYFEKANQKKPGDEEILTWIGYTHQNLGNYHEAQEILLRTFKQNPQSKDILFFLSMSFLYLGDIAKAIDYAEKLVQQDSKDPSTWALAARVYLLTDDEEMGIQYGEKALKLDPKNKTSAFYVFFDRGNFYLNKGQYVKAIESYNNFLEKDSKNAGALVCLGWVYYLNEDAINRIQVAEDLIKQSKKSRTLTKESKIAFTSLGYYLKGDLENALKEAQQAVKSNERCYDALIALAVAYYGKGDYKQSYEAFIRAQQLQAFDPIDKPFFIGVFEAVKQHHEKSS
ncbi:MAG: tetratricopeptide repeat protein [Promethearchaeota archaeon]